MIGNLVRQKCLRLRWKYTQGNLSTQHTVQNQPMISSFTTNSLSTSLQTDAAAHPPCAIPKGTKSWSQIGQQPNRSWMVARLQSRERSIQRFLSRSQILKWRYGLVKLCQDRMQKPVRLPKGSGACGNKIWPRGSGAASGFSPQALIGLLLVPHIMILCIRYVLSEGRSINCPNNITDT